MRILLLCLLGALVLALPGAADIQGPAMPTNLEALNVTEDSFTLVWGPTQPGELTPIAEGGSWLLIEWAPSEDPRSLVTYTVEKDGEDLIAGLQEPQYRFQFLQHTVSFHACVTAYNEMGQASPPKCATFTNSDPNGSQDVAPS